MGDYVGREHIDGILEEAGKREQALIVSGNKHLADSRSMILLAREIRLLKSQLSDLKADWTKEFKRAEVAEAKVAGLMETVKDLSEGIQESEKKLAERDKRIEELEGFLLSLKNEAERGRREG